MLEKGWWQKDIKPFISIIIIMVIIFGVFLMGMSFVVKYIEIWVETYERNNSSYMEK